MEWRLPILICLWGGWQVFVDPDRAGWGVHVVRNGSRVWGCRVDCKTAECAAFEGIEWVKKSEKGNVAEVAGQI